MRSLAAVSIFLLSISASVSATFTVPLTKLRGTGEYYKGTPDLDRARATFFKNRKSNVIGPTTLPATNYRYVEYTTRVGIGSPPVYYDLLVDTASSNTFCGAGISYVQTSTSIDTGNTVSVTYGSGNFVGEEYLDQLTLAPYLVINNQSIGDAISSQGFNGVDGVLGVGPVDLTQGTLQQESQATIPTVMDNLVSQGIIEKKILGVYFAPSNNLTDENGALTYGGVNSSLYDGELTYVPVTKTYPSSQYWGINITSCRYGGHTIIPTSSAGIVDTGTTLVLLANDFFDVYISAIPGTVIDPVTGLIEIPHRSISSMKPLNFTIGGQVFSMDVAAQLVPTDQNTAWGGEAGKYYGIVGSTGNESGRGLDFVIGLKFIERYYTVFDAYANYVAFAQTKNTFTTYDG